MKSRLQTFKRIGIGLAASFLLLLATVATLVESELGSRVALSIVSRLVPVEFIEPRGDLLSGLDMQRVRYEKDGVLVEVINPRFRWRPASALLGTLHIQSLGADTVLVRLPASEAEEDAAPFNQWPNLRLPVRIELEKMSIDNLVLVTGENDPMHWHQLAGSFSLGTFHLRYQNLTLEHEDYALNLTGASLIEYPYTTDARVSFRVGATTPVGANYPAYPYMGRGTLRGDLHKLSFRARSDSPVVMQLEADVELVDEGAYLQTAPLMALTAQWQEQQLPNTWWVPEQTPPVTTAKLSASGTWQSFQAKLLGNLQLVGYPDMHVELDLTGTPQGAEVNRLLLTDNFIDIPLTLWQPPTSTPSPQVPFGAAVNQRLPRVAPSVAPTPAAPVQNPDAQRVEIRGDLSWLPHLSWDVTAQGRNVNFGTLFPEFKSFLAFDFITKGEFHYDSSVWQFAVDALNAEGTLRDQTLMAKGNFLGSSSEWKSSGFDVVFGANTANVSGELSDKSSLNWKIDAPQLGQIYDKFSGSIQTQGSLLLDQTQPRLGMNLIADDFAFAGYAAEELVVYLQPVSGSPVTATPAAASDAPSLTATPTPSAQGVSKNPVTELRNEVAKALWDESFLKHNSYRLSLQGRDLALAGVHMREASIEGTGGWTKHQLTASFEGPAIGDIKLATEGAMQGSAWEGQLTELDLRLPKVPRWWLVNSEPIRISDGKVAFGDQCLTTRGQIVRTSRPTESVTTLTSDAEGERVTSNTQAGAATEPSDARLCVTGALNSQQGLTLDVGLDKAPIRQLYAAFNPDVALTGTLNGTAKVRSPWPIALERVTGEARLSTDAAGVNYRYVGGEVKTYLWERTGLLATLNKGILDVKAQVNWTDYGAFSLLLNTDLKTLNIREGKINANFTNIAPFETFFVNVNELSGSLNGSLNIAGKLNQPQLSGQMQLQNGSASLLSLGITPTNIGMDLRVLNNESIQISAQATSNKGQLAVDAQLQQLSSETWQASGRIMGDDFRILNTSQLRVHVSPNLFIGANRDAITIRGDALIPYARANIKTLPETAIKVSDDVVIMDVENLPEEKKVPWPVELNVKLDVGNDVKFIGFGLNTTLGGSLVLFKEKDWAQPLLNGYVSTKEGTYKAYGQSLNVELGRLIFQGSYDNPGLDIRASRDIAGDDTMKVGLEITGTLQRPAAKVYSTPAMSDSEAMMMLITGRPIKDASRAEATLILGALTSLGDGGEGFTDGLAGIFNVDEFGINANNGIEQSELWVGKYLTPKLLVRYVVGLFDQLVSVGVEYQINSRIRVEAKSGEEQSVDLIYKYER